MSAPTIARNEAIAEELLDEYTLLGAEAPAVASAARSSEEATGTEGGHRRRGAPSRPARRATRAPQVAEPARPDLQVVVRRRRVGVRTATVAGVVLTVVCLFAVVALNALLAQNQYQLEQLEQRREDLTRQNEQKRFVDAQLRAPNRIAEAAAALGMVHARAPMAVTLRGGVGTGPGGAGTAEGTGGGERKGAGRSSP